jgi:transcriptional antiterminator
MCFYTKKEVSELLGFSERTLYRRISKINFKKKSEGNLLTPDEVLLLAKKIGVSVSLPKSA